MHSSIIVITDIILDYMCGVQTKNRAVTGGTSRGSIRKPLRLLGIGSRYASTWYHKVTVVVVKS